MKNRVWIAFAFVAVVCLGLVAFLVVRQVQKQTPARVRMRDGTTLYIRAVLFGTNEFTTETSIKKLARRFLPNAWSSRWLDQPMTSVGGDPNQLRFVLVRKDANGKKLGNFWGKVETVDSKGVVFTDSPGASTMGNNDLLEFTLDTFPRRDEKFLLRMYDMQDLLCAEFAVRNPLVSREFPVWKPEPLPQTATNGPVRFTLKGLRAGTNYYGWYISPRFAIDAPEAGWRSGRKMYHWFTDATGNKGGFLSTNEPAWKMHVQLFRPDASVFPSNLVWRLPLVKVPAALSYTNLNLSNRVDGMQVWVPAICGPGTMTISNFTNVSVAAPILRNSGWSMSERTGVGGGMNRIDVHASDKVFAVVETMAVNDSTELVLRFVDATGKVLKSEHRSGWTGTSDPTRGAIRRYTVELLDTNAPAAALEIKVNSPLEFTFLVDPRDIQFSAK